MCATEISSKSDKTWLISARYREKSEFVIHYISLGSQHAETTASFCTGTLKTKLKGLDHIQSERGGLNVEQLHIIYWYDKCEHFLGEKWQGWKWISLCCPQYLNTQRFKLLMKSCCGSFFPPLSSTYWAVRRNHNWTSFLLEMSFKMSQWKPLQYLASPAFWTVHHHRIETAVISFPDGTLVPLLV